MAVSTQTTLCQCRPHCLAQFFRQYVHSRGPWFVYERGSNIRVWRIFFRSTLCQAVYNTDTATPPFHAMSLYVTEWAMICGKIMPTSFGQITLEKSLTRIANPLLITPRTCYHCVLKTLLMHRVIYTYICVCVWEMYCNSELSQSTQTLREKIYETTFQTYPDLLAYVAFTLSMRNLFAISYNSCTFGAAYSSFILLSTIPSHWSVDCGLHRRII